MKFIFIRLFKNTNERNNIIFDHFSKIKSATTFQVVIAALIYLLYTGIPILEAQEREIILMDKDWRFALGHATDPSKDFMHATGYFSYFAKTGYGDGPASPNFDDRSWRILDIPHDWCVELPFDARGNHSHGYKAIGINFPENSIGWYRKKFIIPESDFGKKLYLHFEGVHRDAKVWVNGFYCGENHSGYYGFEYDISSYLNYGGENVVVVRANASMEEGWYYEGAGIYRHVWLIKTYPLHIADNGTFVTSQLYNSNKNAVIRIGTRVKNDENKTMVFSLKEEIYDATGKMIISGSKNSIRIEPAEEKEIITEYKITNPELWSLENPCLHRLLSRVYAEDSLIDSHETAFGIRSIRFSSDSGFFLNGKPLKIKGTNNHQDFAGVGTAIPDSLQVYRIKLLKEMGSNAIRSSHNPPSTAFLDACDRIGMLVLDENRLMGINEEHLYYLKNMILRDRNHPSVILWSLGNEEWAIEGNEKGKRITSLMQQYAQRLDSTRYITTACSGGWDTGTGAVVQVMGYNYIAQGNIDEHHKKFPWQPAVGTEESNTIGTRGIYLDDEKNGHMAARGNGTEYGWNFYNNRPFLSGLFYWTGFDYRGEPNPLKWPAVSSQYGILDLCGFPKDIYYYLKSWWTLEPVLHIATHWNWEYEPKDSVPVKIYSNCERVELLLNGKSLGKKNMSQNSHLEWKVPYQKGKLMAIGYNQNRKVITSTIVTSDEPYQLNISSNKEVMKSNGQDIAVIKVSVHDKKGIPVPIAQNEILFSVTGPGKIIGVGNGDPGSHENEKYIDIIDNQTLKNTKEHVISSIDDTSLIFSSIDDTDWKAAFSNQPEDWRIYTDSLITVRGTFELADFTDQTVLYFYAKSILENQSIFINGHRIASVIKRDTPNQSFLIDHQFIKKGKNTVAFTGQRFRKKYQWDEPNTDPGIIHIWNPAPQWKRKLFNGLAQVIIQSDDQEGEIIVKAEANGVKPQEIKIMNRK
jgi:beta-galactosidase